MEEVISMKRCRSCAIAILQSAIFVVAVFPLAMIAIYSFELPRNMQGYIQAMEDVRNAGTVPVRLYVQEFSLAQYYHVLIQHTEYIRLYANSIVYSVAITAIQLLLGSLVAFSISCFHLKFRNAVYMLYVVLMLMPFQVLIVPNYFMLRWMRLLNTPYALILSGVFGPLTVFLLRQYMVNLPFSLIEATAIDGGNYLSAYRYVVIPLCKPAIVAAVALLFADAWNMVEQPLVLLQDKTLYPLSLALVDAAFPLEESQYAAIVLFTIPPLLLYLYHHEDLILGIQVGDMK